MQDKTALVFGRDVENVHALEILLICEICVPSFFFTFFAPLR
jgi:hypothetical protein